MLSLVFAEKLLRGVRRIERPPGRIAAGAGVVATDDEVRAAEVLADDAMKQGLARPAHAHRQGQQRQLHSSGG
jgi:hypothetical protein